MQSKEIKELKKYAGKLWNEPTIHDPGEVINKLLTMIDKIPDESPQSKDVEAKEFIEKVANFHPDGNPIELIKEAQKIMAGKLSDNDKQKK